MYLLEYFKSNGETNTLSVDSMNELVGLVNALMVRIEDGRVIYFNVEVINGNVRKD